MNRISVYLLFAVWGQLLMLPAVTGVVPDFSPTGSRLTPATEEDAPTLEPIPGTNNFRLNGKKSKDERPWFNGRDPQHIHCVRSAKCEKIKNQTCFGAKVPYAYTSLDLTDSFNQDETREKLLAYEALRNVPKCWAVIQPFLCAVFVPKCERISNRDMVFLPSLEQCRITLEPCRLLYETPFFPEFLKCNETLFPSKCNNDVREVKFNTTSTCMAPLVATDSASSYYEDIEGCGVQCRDPLYTDDEHRQIHSLNFWCATICMLCNVITIATFLIDWKNANKYPAVIIFYINVCFLINCLAWLAQFTPGNREDIVCRKDGTLRHSEPSAGENLSCIAVFVSIYYTLIAVLVWFVILTYSWHLRAIGNVDRIEKKSSYFHLIAWSLPLVLTIATMALSEVDGNSIAGICFVGYLNHSIRAGFLLGPLSGVLLCGGFFIGRGMFKLLALKRFANEIKSTSASKKIHSIIMRMGITATFAFVFVVVVIMCQVYEFRNAASWAQSLRRLIICKITSSYSDVHQTCKLDSRPSVAVLQLQLLCLFLSGIVMSSWCWTHQTLGAWKRYIKKKLGLETEDDGTKTQKQKQKYKIIAQTYAKRKELQDTGRLSVSFYEAHTDPAGLNFDINDLNSAATNEMSSTWCNYLPKIARRRSAIANSTTSFGDAGTGGGGGGGPRKSSVDSEYSLSVRQFSVESRRNSMDSQVSVKIAEVQTKVACRTSSHVNRAGHRTSSTAKGHRHRHHHHHITSNRLQQQNHRRNSSTSIESQIITSAAYGGRGANFGGVKDKRMRRRSANAGLVDAGDINSFITQFPELTRNFQGMTTTSDDDNASRTSLKIQNSRLDVVVRQNENGRMGQYNNNNDEESDEEECVMVERVGGHHRRQAPMMSQEEMLNDVRRMYPGLTDMMAIRSGAEYTSNTQQRSPGHGEGRGSKNSQRSGGGGGGGVNGSRRKVVSRNGVGGSQKKKRRSTKSRGTSSARNQTTTTLALMDAEPHRMVTTGLSSDSFTSNSSAFALPIVATNGVQSSYSGMSVGKQSRSSKTSCDVGTQANAFEIATQTMSYGDSNEGLLGAIASVKQASTTRAIMGKGQRRDESCDNSDEDSEDRYVESHHLLGAAAIVSAPAPSSTSAASMAMLMMSSASKKREMMTQGRRSEIALSESKKLRMLLHPSK